MKIFGTDQWCYEWVTVSCTECGWSCNTTRAELPCLDNYSVNNHTVFVCEGLEGELEMRAESLVKLPS